MQPLGNEHQAIFSYLRSLDFHFLDTWVIECVNYYKLNNPNISLEYLKNEVKQQWLLVNLREIKVPSLPPDLKSKKKIILNGAYAVQVESMIDSSRSCYSQLQKLMKVDLENIEYTAKPQEREVRPNRCLIFVICDGVQELKAMEYQPITKIKTNDPELLPGFKMVILGPVECRKGMILLKNENVRLCGGEVDTLAVTNKLKNLLIRKLGVDESDYPDSTCPSSTENENINEQLPSRDYIVEDDLGNVQSLLSQNDDLLLNVPLEPEMFASEQQPGENVKEDLDFINENEFLNDNINCFSENQFNQDNYATNNKKHSLPQEEMQMPVKKKLSLGPELTDDVTSSNVDSVIQNSTYPHDEDIFIDDFCESQPTVSGTSLKTIKPVQTKLSSFFKNSSSNSNLSSEYGMSTNAQTPFYVSDKPFVYLKHITSIKLNKPTVFTVKAIILTLRKKITIENDKFNLKLNITDGSSCLDVDICSEILEDFLGFSPCEMREMMKSKQTNSAIAQRIKESFSKAQEKLIHLNCLAKIKFFTEGRCPLILSLEEITNQHLMYLKERS